MTDWPSGPRTIHRVGTMRASPVLWRASRYQMRVTAAAAVSVLTVPLRRRAWSP
jgi:hypothetical protein